MRMMRDMVIDKGSDEVVAVIVARLHSQFKISSVALEGATQRLGL